MQLVSSVRRLLRGSWKLRCHSWRVWMCLDLVVPSRRCAHSHCLLWEHLFIRDVILKGRFGLMNTQAKMACSVAAVTAVLLWACGPLASAGEAPSLDFVRAALQKQATATVEVSYTLDSDVPATVRRYIRSADVLYRKDRLQEVSSERSGVEGILNLRAKSEGAGGEPRGAVLTIRPNVTYDGWLVTDRIDPVLLPILPRPDDSRTWCLYGWLKYGNVSSTAESIEGHDCWKVEITDTGNSPQKRLQTWLDPSIGFNPRRVMTEAKDDAWTKVVEFKDYREIAAGIWFPAQQILTTNWPKGGMVDARNVFQATEIHGDRQFSKDELVVKFSPGTKVSVQLPDGGIDQIIEP